MKNPNIGKMKTVVRIETNVPKLQYGSGRIGAGFLDTYYPLKTVRGEFYTVNGSRVLASGAVTMEQRNKLKIRFDPVVSNAINKQMRFVIDNKVYTMEDFKYGEEGRKTHIEFTLSLYTRV